MSDDIVLRGGGVVAVATDGHLDLARVLAWLAASCEEWGGQLDTVGQMDTSRAPTGPLLVPQLDGEAGREAVERAAAKLRHAAGDASHLGGRLVLSAEAYGDIERMVASLFELTDGANAWVSGALPVNWVPGAVGVGAVLLLGTLVRAAVGAVSREAGEQFDAATEKGLRDLMATPLFADAVRRIVSSADEWLVGAGGIPAGIVSMLASAEGVPGVALAALVVARTADGTGLFTDTGVRASAAPSSEDDDGRVPPPTTYEELARRMPHGGDGSPQIRIERHVDAAGAEQWIVWSGGTIDTGFPTSGSEPWDNRSNLYGVAASALPGLAADSTRATLQAMELAGVPKGASVLHVGYSQGGIVAAAIAASGDYDSSLVTFGSPVDTVVFDEDVPRAHFEHTEDVIPALSGRHEGQPAGGTVISRSLYDGATPPSGDDPLPAHGLENYQNTARLADTSADPRLRKVIGPLAELADDGRSSQYRAERVE
jgi:hypothetical protein